MYHADVTAIERWWCARSGQRYIAQVDKAMLDAVSSRNGLADKLRQLGMVGIRIDDYANHDRFSNLECDPNRYALVSKRG